MHITMYMQQYISLAIHLTGFSVFWKVLRYPEPFNSIYSCLLAFFFFFSFVGYIYSDYYFISF